MLDWHLGMVEGSAGESRAQLSAADALTLSRIGLAPILAAQGRRPCPNRSAFAVLLAVAAMTDALDGSLARRVGPTRLGRDLDTVADASTAMAAARAAWIAGWLPGGAVSLTVARSAAPIAILATTYFLTAGRPPAETLEATRGLAPAVLGGIAAAPFAPRAGAVVTTVASIASLLSRCANMTAGQRPWETAGGSSSQPQMAQT
jgi:phosphatidylglycerophosphate synthase